MRQKKNTSCDKETYCSVLRERVTDIGKIGIQIHTYKSMKTGDTTRRLAVHHFDKSDKGGVALNFCPWCGFEFSKRTDWGGPK